MKKTKNKKKKKQKKKKKRLTCVVADTDFDIALEPALSDIQTSGDQFNNTFFIEHLSYPTKCTSEKFKYRPLSLAKKGDNVLDSICLSLCVRSHA